VWLFASINRVYELAADGDQIFALYLLQRSLSSAQGLLNAFAYGFSGACWCILLRKCWMVSFSEAASHPPRVTVKSRLSATDACAACCLVCRWCA